MAENNFEKIIKYSPHAFDKVFAANAKSAVLVNSQKFVDVNFKEAGYVKLFSMTVDRLGQYLRAGGATTDAGHTQYNGAGERTGYKIGSATNKWTLYPLRFDRGIQIPVDRMDNEETANTIMAHLEAEVLRTGAVPEVDTITFSTIADNCSTTLGNKLVEQTIDKDKIVENLDIGFEWLTEHQVPEEEQVIFMSPKMFRYMKGSSELIRYITQTDLESADGITRRLNAYNGRPIVVVPSDRFYTDAEVSDNGYGPTSTSRVINYMIVSKQAVIPIKKLETVRILSGDNVPNFDGYLMNMRMYYDIIVPKNKVIGSYVNVGATLGTAVANTMSVDVKYVSATSLLFKNFFTSPAGINGKPVYLKTAMTVGSKYATAQELTINETFTKSTETSGYFAILDGDNKALAVSGEITLPTA